MSKKKSKQYMVNTCVLQKEKKYPYYSQAVMATWLPMTGAEYLLPGKCSHIFLVFVFENRDVVANDWYIILTAMPKPPHFSGLCV